MKRVFTAILILAALSGTVNSEENNDFYDNSKTYPLELPEVRVEGEVSNPGSVDFSGLSRHSVIVRETFLDGSGKPSFTGAYRYDGYSLFDILKERYVSKKNKDEFSPVIDLLVLVENEDGEKAVFSWGEIFYPDNLHRILVATGVSPIIPTKSREQWPVPETGKLVCAVDMISERNISNPSKITVMTQPLRFEVDRDLDPLYSEKVKVHIKGRPVNDITSLEDYGRSREYPAVFYGRGRGFHGLRHFRGKLLKNILKKDLRISSDNLRRGYFCVSAADGYRITMTFSEIFNRNDHADFIMTDQGVGTDGGRFLLYPAPDFFSDRAVKAITDIYFRRM